MKRNIYYAMSYDGMIKKVYYNYKSAVNFCNKLIRDNINCGIYVWNDDAKKLDCIIGC